MNNRMPIIVAAMAVAAAGYAGSVAAQDMTYVSDRGDVIHCQSTAQGRIAACGDAYTPVNYTAEPRVVRCAATGDGRAYCGRASVQYVVVGTEQNPVCVEGSTWGMDDGRLWVAGHCAAYF